MTARVKTLEEGQYKLFNILKEIQEWWEAQAIVAVIGQNASMDSEEEDTHARNFTLPWACPSQMKIVSN